MPVREDLDERRVIQRIREDLRLRVRSAEPSRPSPGVAPVMDDLSLMRAGFDIYSTVPLKSPRKILGTPVTFAKKLLRRLMAPILERQVAYNAANTRVVQELKNQLESAAQDQRASENIARVERRMRSLLHLLEQGAGRPGSVAESVQDGDGIRREPLVGREFDYSGLEDRFRGSETEIKDRQRRYLKYFDGRESVLDVACGRGEFLELLREAGVRASGVDLNLDMVLLCREKGLDIAHGDAFAYLQGIPDGSLGGVFSAQFIEHCPPREVFRLAQLCMGKLRPGGVLIFETINPKCLSVFARSFYLDPTHVWPFHPELARFILETAGFVDITLDFFSPVDPEVRLPHLDAGNLSGVDKERLDRSVDIVNELLFGDQEYAIVGAKPLLDAAAG